MIHTLGANLGVATLASRIKVRDGKESSVDFIFEVLRKLHGLKACLSVEPRMTLLEGSIQLLMIFFAAQSEAVVSMTGVVNRCQQDINNHRSMPEARKSEQEFFDSHEEYAVSSQCGFANLARASIVSWWTIFEDCCLVSEPP